MTGRVVAPAIYSYGTSVPCHRMERAEIGDALRVRVGKGTRSVAGFDQDSTTLAVDASLGAVADLRSQVARTYLATTAPAYADKANAAIVHAALGLDRAALAFDVVGSVRSGIGALIAGLDAPEPVLVAMADVRFGRPGSSDERDGGDGAAAFVVGRVPHLAPLATVLGHGAATVEVLDRWRVPGALGSQTWEERFAEPVYAEAAGDALRAALRSADLTIDEVDHLVVTGVSSRAAANVIRSSGARSSAVHDDLSSAIGTTGAAHGGLLLADALDRAKPGDSVAVVVIADGATAIVLRAEAALADLRPALSVRESISQTRTVRYHDVLTWRGVLDREPPRRPEPEPPAAPPALRDAGWKFALQGARCTACGAVTLPPGRVCPACHAVDSGEPVSKVGSPGRIATFTVDHLAFTMNPPLASAVVDFEDGGRARFSLTDLDPDRLAIGDRVELTFRRMYSARGVHNYFWKIRPA